MHEALVGAKPPHLMAFSKHFDSAARTLDKAQESFKTGAIVAPISNKHPYPSGQRKSCSKLQIVRNNKPYCPFTTTIKTNTKITYSKGHI